MLSRLTQARGLKLAKDWTNAKLYMVAPHAGAWIETVVKFPPAPKENVAPHAGAWIETPTTTG